MQSECPAPSTPLRSTVARILDRSTPLRLSFSAALGVGLILYLSLRTSPSLVELSWLPDWLSRWADRHGDFRTLIPYAAASSYIGLEACWIFRRSTSLPALIWLLAAYGLLALLCLTELIQIPLSRRTFSWLDLLWGGLGILSGVLPIWIQAQLRKLLGAH